MFQFHSGSIQTGIISSDYAAIWKSFNSTLVRFKPRKALEEFGENAVSIPLWFDSNQ